MLKHFLCMLLLFTATFLPAQSLWTDFAEQNLPKEKSSQRLIVPRQYRAVRLDLAQLAPLLSLAPERFTAEAAGPATVLTLPLPDGKWGRFRITESPVMAKELQFRYPEIRCYTGIGIDDPTATLKCDLTPQGFHAMIRSAVSGTVFIDPYASGDLDHYLVYNKKDLSSKKAGFTCELDTPVLKPDPVKLADAPEMQGDCTLRRYRMALGCTGEYTAFHGGTKPLALAAISTTLNRVNGIYERDLGLTMQLIPNNDTLVYVNAATDGYSNGNVLSMLTQHQSKCNTIIGSVNYDIGHAFGTGGGGIASVGVVCGNSVKARGITGISQPIGDPFDVDFVAHEIGHQFGADHTQNNPCEQAPLSAMEPGSGSTIMGYAGICPPNVQSNSDDYFHAISLQEMQTYILTGPGGVCPVEVATGNQGPSVEAGPNRTIPKSTPFALMATASDANGDSLTYCWEQMDNQQAPMPPQAGNTGGPMFRSFKPGPAPTRYFPRLTDLVNNVNPTWEELPGVARTLNFRVTVRDNHPAGGCTAEDNLTLTVSGTAGPFVVTHPNTALTWFVGDTETVTWDVANTNVAPVGCTEVRILLSKDGGFTYPVVLANAVPNTGSAQVDVPDELSDNCRIMVQAVGNVFFDISNQNFSIKAPLVPTFLLDISAAAAEQVCLGDTLGFTATLSPIAGFQDSAALSLSGAPAGASVTISPNPIAPGDTARITLANLTTVGVYSLVLEAVSGSITRTRTVALTVLDGAPAPPALVNPADGAGGLPLTPSLQWSAVPDALHYQLQVATSPAFSSSTLVFDAVITNAEAVLSGLDSSTVYYWRVKVENACGQSDFSPVSAFQTGYPLCDQTYTSTNVPVVIADNDVNTIQSVITVPENRFVADVNLHVAIDHTWVGDLKATLFSPAAVPALLFDQPGYPGASSGCGGDNLDLELNDEAGQTAAQLENTCNNEPAISGAFQPVDLLNRYDNTPAQGVWTLEIVDNFPEDGGALNAWSLTFCFFDSVPAATLLVNQPLTVISGGTGNLTTGNLVLQIESANPDDGVFLLLSVPQHGVLQRDGVDLAPGDAFTQADVLAGLVTYVHNGDGATSDSFLFDAVDNSSHGWVHQAVFSLVILQNDLVVSAEITQTLLCHNDSTGQISVAVAGGNPPFSYRLNGGTSQFLPVFDNLPAGTYTVVVTDQVGFTAESNAVVLDNPAPVDVAAAVSFNDITVQATGGVPPYSYSLDGMAFQNGNLFENLPNGAYVVTVRDTNGCTGTDTVEIAVPALESMLTLAAAISCAGSTDGSVLVTISGGVPPYQYSLDGVNVQPDSLFTGLGAGTYAVTVQDDSGNTATSNAVLLEEPAALSIAAVADLNKITVSASGGTGMLVFSLDGQLFQSDTVFGGLANGDYTITVKDANGCTAVATATVAVPDLQILSLTVVGEIVCFGETVSVLVSATGGVPPYAYSLNGSPFQPDSLFENVGAGIFTVDVSDAAGTVIQSQVLVISAPPALLGTAGLSGNDASIKVTGGQPPYGYSLNGAPSQPDSTFSDLPDGDYTVVVTDANGCSTTVSFVVLYPPLTLMVTGSDPLCSGEATGAIDLVVGGGTPPYACTVNNDVNCQLTGLPAGAYDILFVDALGDSVETTVTLADPPALAASAVVSSDTITVDAGGGTGVLRFSLDGTNFQDEPVFPGLSNGTYTVYVQDENGCLLTIENVVVDFVGTVSLEKAWGLVVHPNPGNGLFTLSFRDAPSGQLRVDVFDSAGRRLLEQRHTPQGGAWNIRLDLTGFPSGVYWLRLTSGSEAGMMRLVIR